MGTGRFSAQRNLEIRGERVFGSQMKAVGKRIGIASGITRET
jgi:hypothetical protein